MVPTSTLEGLLDEHGFDTVDLLKVDIEGAEARVLRSVDRWIERVRWAVVEVHFDALSMGDFLRALAPHDRGLFVRARRPSRRWVPLDDRIADALPSLTSSIDVLVAPAEAAALVRA